MGSLEAARRSFAEELKHVASVTHQPVIDAFARIPRERFVGPGPWELIGSGFRRSTTPDADPRHLYHDVLVTLDAGRGLNNGAPSLWAMVFDRLAPGVGEHVVHIGAGTGYYTAVLAELVGEKGRVTGIEVLPELAARAKANLAERPNVRVIEGDGTAIDPGAADVIVVNAGATHPMRLWVDSLKPGGRLLVPLTADLGLPGGAGWGALLKITRMDGGMLAGFLGPVGIYPCQGARSAEHSKAIQGFMNQGIRAFTALRSLRRDPHPSDDTCWLHTKELCLSKTALH